VFNEERAKQACASGPTQHRILPRASGQRYACIRLEAETAQYRGSERRKEQQRIRPSTASCILLSAIKFKWRAREDYSRLAVLDWHLRPHLWELVDLWILKKWRLDQLRLVRPGRVVKHARARVVRRAVAIASK